MKVKNFQSPNGEDYLTDRIGEPLKILQVPPVETDSHMSICEKLWKIFKVQPANKRPKEKAADATSR